MLRALWMGLWRSLRPPPGLPMRQAATRGRGAFMAPCGRPGWPDHVAGVVVAPKPPDIRPTANPTTGAPGGPIEQAPTSEDRMTYTTPNPAAGPQDRDPNLRKIGIQRLLNRTAAGICFSEPSGMGSCGWPGRCPRSTAADKNCAWLAASPGLPTTSTDL